jgi:hypothetical protein
MTDDLPDDNAPKNFPVLREFLRQYFSLAPRDLTDPTARAKGESRLAEALICPALDWQCQRA